MKKFQNRWTKFIISGAVLIIIYKLINNFSGAVGVFNRIFSILLPILLGVAIAFFLLKPSEKLAEVIKKINIKFIKEKALVISVIIVYLVIFVIIVLIIKYIAPKIYKNIEELASNVPEYYKIISKYISENQFLSKFNSIEFLTVKIESMFDITQINKYISIISGIANSFITTFLAVILSIYMIIEKQGIFEFLRKCSKRFLSEKVQKAVYIYGNKTVNRFYSYFTGLALDAILVGVVCSIFFILMKIPYALLLGVLVAFGNLIPFFGPIISNIILFLISLLTVGPLKTLWVIVFQLIFGQIDGNIIQPKIIGNSTGISPLLVLVTIIIFGELFGFLGMLIGVPVCAVIKDVVVDYVDNGKLDEIQ